MLNLITYCVIQNMNSCLRFLPDLSGKNNNKEKRGWWTLCRWKRSASFAGESGVGSDGTNPLAVSLR